MKAKSDRLLVYKETPPRAGAPDKSAMPDYAATAIFTSRVSHS